jgi:uncharacterized protein YkwD
VTKRLAFVLLALLAACGPNPVLTPAAKAAVSVMTFTPAPGSPATLPPAATVTATPAQLLDVAGAAGQDPAPELATSTATSAPPPAAVVPPPVPPDVAAAEQACVDQINAERAKAGVPALAPNATLMQIAEARAADMVARHYTGHYDPVTGVGLGKQMMRAAGFTTGFMGENWYGHVDGPAAAVDVAMAWFMTDPPHADNILSVNYHNAGCGIAFNGQQWLLVQDFAG